MARGGVGWSATVSARLSGEHGCGLIFTSAGALVGSGLGDKEQGSYAMARPSRTWKRAKVAWLGSRHGVASSGGVESTDAMTRGARRWVVATPLGWLLDRMLLMEMGQVGC
jgi:hypothetical protein